MKILGIETSCDETAAAVIDGGRVLSNVVSSQVELHGKYFGVVPELASRAHQQKIPGVIEQAIADAFPGAKLSDLRELVDAVAFTQGPGLAGALLVGKVAAQTLAFAHRLPLIGVNHLEGHAFAIELAESAPRARSTTSLAAPTAYSEQGARPPSQYLADMPARHVRSARFPFIALIVSGGHTDLALVSGYGEYRVLGRTRDDAAGEAFDKVAKLLGLGYPGGPIIDRLALKGDPAAIRFPRPMLPDSWDFSFSGLKTSVLYHVQGKKSSFSRSGPFPHPRSFQKGERAPQSGEIADLCASFQESVVDTLVEKALAAASEFKAKSVVVGGGVAANSRLRAVLNERGSSRGLRIHFPPPSLCTDNGAMIARVAWLRLNVPRKPRRVESKAERRERMSPAAAEERRLSRGMRSARGYRIDPSMPMRNW